jgi:hypothetical protein
MPGNVRRWLSSLSSLSSRLSSAAAEMPRSGPHRSIDANDFGKTYPGLVSLAERHPYRIAFATAAVICAALMALVLVSIATAP